MKVVHFLFEINQRVILPSGVVGRVYRLTCGWDGHNMVSVRWLDDDNQIRTCEFAELELRAA